jgi:hypothetical protein
MIPLGDKQPPEVVTYFGANTTLRLEVNPSDYVLWVRWKHIFSPTNDIDVLDFWEMKEGDSVAITSRIEDLPPWFELHPTEVSGAACYWMMKKLESGYRPSEPADGPNLWRVQTGDRLLWVKCPDLQTGQPRHSVIAFESDALLFGEGHVHPGDLASFISFGAPLESSASKELVFQVRAGLEVVRKMGLPRNMPDISAKWTLG